MRDRAIKDLLIFILKNNPKGSEFQIYNAWNEQSGFVIGSQDIGMMMRMIRLMGECRLPEDLKADCLDIIS